MANALLAQELIEAVVVTFSLIVSDTLTDGRLRV